MSIMDERNDVMSLRLYNRIAAGMLAGLVGGLLMTIVLSAGFAIMDRSPVFPLRLIAVTLVGDTALLPSAATWASLVGFVVHMITAAFTGGLFGAMTISRSKTQLSVAGLVYGVALWFFMQHIFLPTGINLPLATRMPQLIYALAHVVFGLSLASLLHFEHRLIQRYLETRPENLAVESATEYPPHRRTAVG